MQESPPPGPPGGLDRHPVLFFDGECGLCNRLVRLLLRLDRKAVLRFGPLQGSTAQQYLRTHGLPTADFDTLIYAPDWNRREFPEFLVRTAGVIAALRATGDDIENVMPHEIWPLATYREMLFIK